MTEYKELIEKAQKATKQELGDQWSGKWRETSRMPESFYWENVRRMLKNEPRNLVIEQDEIGIVIDQITRKGEYAIRVTRVFSIFTNPTN